MHALQIEAGAERRQEGGERQQADGERIGAHVLDQLPRHQRAERDAEQHQHGLRHHRRQHHLASGECGSADRDHGAGNQPAGQMSPYEQHSPGCADHERFQHLESLGSARQGGNLEGGYPGHAALWQIAP